VGADPLEDRPLVRAVRRSPAEADVLRARMLREGYPLRDLTRKENEWVWISLTQGRRWDHLHQLTGMDRAQFRARLRELSAQHVAATGRR
jgi:hypothetical protein